MPLDVDPGRQPRPRGGRVTASLDSEVWTALGTVARGIDATPFRVLHSAVAVLLSAITGTPDTLLGTAESGRNDPLLDELVGMFVGTVALRAHVHGDATFPDLVDAVRASDIDAFVHATTPFDVVQERCGGSTAAGDARVRRERRRFRPSCGRGWKVRGRAVPGTDARSDLDIAVARDGSRPRDRVRVRLVRPGPANRAGLGELASGPSSTAWPWTASAHRGPG
ncbi:hypothetical protein GS415_04120 [Rhodococcus hoagii]|nr:hypothetical protein [Prescottella equi]